MSALLRPDPPEGLGEDVFVPAPRLAEWTRRAFIEKDGPFYCEGHSHLLEARIVFCWTSAEGRSRGKAIAGQAQLLDVRGRQWSKLRDYDRLRSWWREMPDYEEETEPDFSVTLYAPYCAAASDAAFCALDDHELFHCGQSKDGYGVPRFNQETGRPDWTIVGHDVEEFVSVVDRWGTPHPELERLVRAASKPPLIAAAGVAAGCGTCKRIA